MHTYIIINYTGKLLSYDNEHNTALQVAIILVAMASGKNIILGTKILAKVPNW